MVYAIRKVVGFILLVFTVGGVSIASIVHLIPPLF